MKRSKRPGLKGKAIAAGLAATLIITATACQSTEQEVLEPAPPQITAPLDDGGFRNLATNRALTPEEWARLMGHPDITDNARIDDEENGPAIMTDDSPVLEAEDMDAVTKEENPQGTLPEDGNEVIEFQPEGEDAGQGLPDGQRIINETEEGTAIIEDGIIPDIDYQEGDVHLAGEPVSESDDIRDVPISMIEGSVVIIEDDTVPEKMETMDPGVIMEMAEASPNRPGEATITTFIIDHFAYMFLGAFGLLAILIFAAMSRFASSGDESSIRMNRKKDKKKKDTAPVDTGSYETGPLPSGKSMVFGDESEADSQTPESAKPFAGRQTDDLELEPVDDDMPGYDNTIRKG